MTLLELISYCVKYITITNDNINPLSLATFSESEEYKAFINNSLPQINNAIQKISLAKKLPLQMLEYEYNTITSGKSYINIPIKDFVGENKDKYQISEIFKLNFEDIYGNLYDIEYMLFGDSIRCLNPKMYGTFYLRFYPRVRLFTEEDKGSNSLSYTELTMDEFLTEKENGTLSPMQYYRVDDGNIYQIDLDGNVSKVNEKEYDNSILLSDYSIDNSMCTTVIAPFVKSVLWQDIEPSLAQVENSNAVMYLSMLPDGDNYEPMQTQIDYRGY